MDITTQEGGVKAQQTRVPVSMTPGEAEHLACCLVADCPRAEDSWPWLRLIGRLVQAAGLLEEAEEATQDKPAPEPAPKPSAPLFAVDEPVAIKDPQTGGQPTAVVIRLAQAEIAAARASQGVKAAAKAANLPESHCELLLSWAADQLGMARGLLGRTPNSKGDAVKQWLREQACSSGLVHVPVGAKVRLN